MCVVVVGPLKAQLVLFRFASERRVSRMSCTSSPAWKWKRGPLAPVVVVGEGQVNLVFRPAVEPAGAMNDRRYRRSVVCGSSSSLQYLLLQPVAPVSSFVVRGSSLQYLSSCCLCNTPLLPRVKSRTANNCASLSGRHTAVHVS